MVNSQYWEVNVKEQPRPTVCISYIIFYTHLTPDHLHFILNLAMDGYSLKLLDSRIGKYITKKSPKARSTI